MIVFNLYRGRKSYTYQRQYRSVVQHNPNSGHSWTVDQPLNKWDIVSPLVGVIQTVNSEDRAIQLCEEYGESDIYMPLTERELEKMRDGLEKV